MRAYLARAMEGSLDRVHRQWNLYLYSMVSQFVDHDGIRGSPPQYF